MPDSVPDGAPEVNDRVEVMAVDPTDMHLWRTLQPLRSAAVWLMVGAHPDDEWSGLLAWLAFQRGVRTIFACATRGEGGQNALGPARGRALGALRSREMECAAAELALAVRWLGAGPGRGDDDPINDFGFSKSGDDTLARWGDELLVERLVRLIRHERPDIVSPTFLDVPGQHGHHCAVTRCTLRAVELAADPGWYLPHGDLPAWNVAKLYLPAFSGAGGAYDDREPPPEATTHVDLGEHCGPLGASWAQIGERSRRWHASQGMGREIASGPRPFALHLRRGVRDTTLPMDGVDHALSTFDNRLDAATTVALATADAAIADALTAFPDRHRIATAAHRALGALASLDHLPAGIDIAARVELKRRQLGRAAASALGISAALTITPTVPRCGTTVTACLRMLGDAAPQLRLPPGWTASAGAKHTYQLAIPPGAAPFGTLRDAYDPLGGNDPFGARLSWVHAGSAATIEIDPPDRLALAPAIDVSVEPMRIVRSMSSKSPATLRLTGAPVPQAWPVRTVTGDLVAIAARAGKTHLPSAGGRLALLAHPHVGASAILEAANPVLLRSPIAVDQAAHVGVIAGDADETIGWLRQLDIPADAIDDQALARDGLVMFSTLLVGITGFEQLPALRANRARLAAWVQAGGSLVSLYQRPGEGWGDGPLPLRLNIGAPSLRWRVTDPASPVAVLLPDHELLRAPNAIGPADWNGWVRERGLYFASSWDAAYTPLLALADPGEAPLTGSLLVARLGKGRHVHVALALHHQFTALVPGALRLLANLVARPECLRPPAPLSRDG